MTGNTLIVIDGKNLWLNKVRSDGYDVNDYFQKEKINWNGNGRNIIVAYQKYRGEKGGDLRENKQGRIFMCSFKPAKASPKKQFDVALDLAHKVMGTSKENWDGFLTSYSDYCVIVNLQNGTAHLIAHKTVLIASKEPTSISNIPQRIQNKKKQLTQIINDTLNIPQVKESETCIRALQELLSNYECKVVGNEIHITRHGNFYTKASATSILQAEIIQVLDTHSIRKVPKSLPNSHLILNKTRRLKNKMPKEVYLQFCALEKLVRATKCDEVDTAIQSSISESCGWNWKVTVGYRTYSLYSVASKEIYAVVTLGEREHPHFKTVKEWQLSLQAYICQQTLKYLEIPELANIRTAGADIRESIAFKESYDYALNPNK